MGERGALHSLRFAFAASESLCRVDQLMELRTDLFVIDDEDRCYSGACDVLPCPVAAVRKGWCVYDAKRSMRHEGEEKRANFGPRLYA